MRWPGWFDHAGRAPWHTGPAVVTSARVADLFERIATLLEEQAASPYRVRAWREAASAIRAEPRELADVFHDHGRVGLEAIPHIGRHLSAVIIELLRTGHTAVLDRLRGEVHGEDRVEPHVEPEPPPDRHGLTPPPVAVLLDVDRRYRGDAAAGRLRKIAPHNFNPRGEAWLPVLHEERDGWVLTALYSNTARAHQLGRTHDWVVIYYHHPHDGEEGRATVVTEHRGPWRGHRVVRGREAECAIHALALGEEPAI